MARRFDQTDAHPRLCNFVSGQKEAERILTHNGYIQNTSLILLKRIGELAKKEDTLAGINQGATATKTLMATLSIPVSTNKEPEQQSSGNIAEMMKEFANNLPK